MEIAILAERELHLSPTHRIHNFHLDRTIVSAQTRKATLPNFRLGEDILDGLRSDGVTPMIGVDAMASIEMYVGFHWGITRRRPHTGLIELKLLDDYLERVFGNETGWTGQVELQLDIHRLVKRQPANRQNCVVTPIQQTRK